MVLGLLGLSCFVVGCPGEEAGRPDAGDGGGAGLPCDLPPDQSTPLPQPPGDVFSLSPDWDGGYYALISTCSVDPAASYDNPCTGGGWDQSIWHLALPGNWTQVSPGLGAFAAAGIYGIGAGPVWTPGHLLFADCSNDCTVASLALDGGASEEVGPFSQEQGPAEESLSLSWNANMGLVASASYWGLHGPVAGGLYRQDDDGGWSQLSNAVPFASGVAALGDQVYWIGLDGWAGVNAPQVAIKNLDGGSWSIGYPATAGASLVALRPGVFVANPGTSPLLLVGEGDVMPLTDCQTLVFAFAAYGDHAIIYSAFTPSWQLDGGDQVARLRMLEIP